MSLFDDSFFDLNGDGKTDAFEMMAGIQMCASSRREAIELTGDDTFYLGDDEITDDSEYD